MRFTWWCLRALVVVMSLAVVAGLAASVNVTPARADATVNITLDPGAPIDAPTLQQAINQWTSYGTLADATNRTIDSNFLNISGFNVPMQASFTGSVNITPDGTGLSVNVTAGDAATNPGNLFWTSGLGGLLGFLAGGLVRSWCELAVYPFGPQNDTWKKKTIIICGSVGGLFATYLAGWFGLVLQGKAGDPTSNIQAIARSIGAGLIGTALWEAGVIRDIGQWLANLAFGLAGMQFPTFPPAVQAAVTDTATGISYLSQAWDADADSLLNLTFPIGPSSPPCDIYNHYDSPCGDAYSTTRALYSSYNGPLYQVQRSSDGATDNIYPLSPGGAVDGASQVSFCPTTCTISKVYDQSPDWDDLTVPGPDHPALAAALPIQVGGNDAYGMYVTPGVGYRDNAAQNLATNGDPEGMYMVASGTHVNSGCCFDFGNAETNSQDNGAGHMDAVNLTTYCGSNSSPCTGSGPWVEADMENGQWMGNGSNPANLGNNSNFVTAMLENDGQSTFALEGGNSQSGGLSTWWNGSLPTTEPGYIPMKQEGAVILGTGGDNSNSDVGSFFEGAMTIGYPAAVADALIQQNIVLAGYTGNSGGNGAGLVPPAGTITVPSGKCVDVLGDDTGTDGTPVDEWDCQSSAYDQHWTHNANGELETLGRCLGISIAQGVGGTGTGVAGDHLTLWDCNGSGVEDWVQQPDGTLLNPPSGLCLYGQPANGYQLQVVNCNASDPNQHFAVNGGNPITVPSGQCVDVLGDDTGTDGTPADIWDCQSYAVDQHWTPGPNHSLETLGRCLGISIAQGVGGTGTGVAGDHLTLWDCNGSGVEDWVQQPDGTLLNPPSGLCLYGQPANGYQLQVVNCNASDPNQHFAAWDAALIPPAGTITVPGGQCVDVLGDDTGTDGTPVDIWDCQAYAVDQHWTHNADGSLETLGRCLGISTAQGVGGTGTGVAGDHITLWDCNGSDVERWLYEADGLIVNPATGLCLYGQHSNGYQLQVVNCNVTDPSQQFSVNGGSPAVNTPSGQCVDVLGDDNGGQGTPVDLWGCQSYALDQHWTYGPNGSLQTLGLCLDTVGPSIDADSQVTVADCDGSSTQQWVQQSNGAVLNVGSGLCLDDPNSNTNDGTRLQIWTCNGGTNQVFVLGL